MQFRIREREAGDSSEHPPKIARHDRTGSGAITNAGARRFGSHRGDPVQRLQALPEALPHSFPRRTPLEEGNAVLLEDRHHRPEVLEVFGREGSFLWGEVQPFFVAAAHIFERPKPTIRVHVPRPTIKSMSLTILVLAALAVGAVATLCFIRYVRFNPRVDYLILGSFALAVMFNKLAIRRLRERLEDVARRDRTAGVAFTWSSLLRPAWGLAVIGLAAAVLCRAVGLLDDALDAFNSQFDQLFPIWHEATDIEDWILTPPALALVVALYLLLDWRQSLSCLLQSACFAASIKVGAALAPAVLEAGVGLVHPWVNVTSAIVGSLLGIQCVVLLLRTGRQHRVVARLICGFQYVWLHFIYNPLFFQPRVRQVSRYVDDRNLHTDDEDEILDMGWIQSIQKFCSMSVQMLHMQVVTSTLATFPGRVADSNF